MVTLFGGISDPANVYDGTFYKNILQVLQILQNLAKHCITGLWQGLKYPSGTHH